MNQRLAEPDVTILRDQSTVEDYLKTLWERVRTAGEMIKALRSEKEGLVARVDQLENELTALREAVQQREQELKRLRAERSQLLSDTGNSGFSEDERVALRNKIHDIISKINSHL